MGNYWNTNFKEGYAEAYKKMGVGGYFVDILISLLVAWWLGEDIKEGIRIFLLVMFGVFGIFGLYHSVVVTPRNRHDEQQEILNQYKAHELRLISKIYGPNRSRKIKTEDVILASFKNIGTKKIVDLDIRIQSVRFIVINNGKLENPRSHTNMTGVMGWENGNKYIEIHPEDEKRAYFVITDREMDTIQFASPGIAKTYFPREGVHEVTLRLRGKEEGTADYLFYNHLVYVYWRPTLEGVDGRLAVLNERTGRHEDIPSLFFTLIDDINI